MKKTFKKYFVPHKENEYKPHLLRIEASLFVLSLILILEVVFISGGAIINGRGFLASILPSVLIDETNISRNLALENSLTLNTLLQEAAERKAFDMADKGYFAHTGPDGKKPWDWIIESGYKYRFAGENLAVNFTDSKDVIDAWMKSPSHKANILNDQFTEIGIGTAEGSYKNQKTVFIVQYFGRPAFIPFTSISEASPPPATIPATNPTPSPSPVPNGDQVALSEIPSENGTVLGEPVGIEETFIETSNPELIGENPDNIQAPSGGYATFFEQIIASPRNLTSYFLIILATMISLALVLKIFVRVNGRHPSLIINGVVMLLIITTALTLNQYISLYSAAIK